MTVAIRTPPDRKTKIVVTLGPSSQSPEVIRDLIKNGMNVARFNFSHGTHESHTQALRIVRSEAQNIGAHIAVFQDLCGPKVRIGDLSGGQVTLVEGQTVLLRHKTAAEVGDVQLLYVEAFDPVAVIKPGEKALLADGRIELTAEAVTAEGVRCTVRAGGPLRSRSGISVPDSALNLPCLTEKDIHDVSWAIANEVDYVALSFTGTARDVLTLKQVIREKGGNIPVIAKIERASSLDHLEEIVEAADAVMVARGDLGLELPLERVPMAQKLIIQTANYVGTPVITATQMLQSMVKEVRPTRAEVSDVCTAVRDGTDAVMLSEETAIGDHPALSVEVLSRIVKEAEREFCGPASRTQLKHSDRETVADAVCYAAAGAADKVNASAIIACTQSGYTGRLMAKYRPTQTLYGATAEKKTLSRLALNWGIEPVFINLSSDSTTEEEIKTAMIAVRDQYGLKPGCRVVITAGLRAGHRGSTTLMEIREIQRT